MALSSASLILWPAKLSFSALAKMRDGVPNKLTCFSSFCAVSTLVSSVFDFCLSALPLPESSMLIVLNHSCTSASAKFALMLNPVPMLAMSLSPNAKCARENCISLCGRTPSKRMRSPSLASMFDALPLPSLTIDKGRLVPAGVSNGAGNTLCVAVRSAFKLAV